MKKTSLKKDFRELYGNLFLYLSISIGIILRVIYLLKKPLEFDEAVVWKVANLPLKDIVSGNFFEFRFHPPLLYLFIHYWKYISESEIWLRLPSLIASVASIFLLYIFLKNLLNKRIATLGVFLYSTSTFAIQWSTQLRVYQMLFMVSLIYLLVYTQFLKGAKKNIYLFLLFAIGALCFHLDYSFIWTFLAVNTHFILLNINKILKKETVRWLFVNLLIFSNLLFYIVKIGQTTINSHSALTAISPPSLWTIVSLFFEFLFSDRWNSLWVQYSFYLSLFFFSTIILFLYLVLKESIIIGKDKNKLLISLAIWVPLLISIIVSQFYPIFVSKNLFVVSLGIIICLAISLEKLSKYKIVFSLLLLMWFISNLSQISQFYNNDPQWGKTVIFYKNEVTVDSKILFLPAWFKESFLYYNRKFNLINFEKLMFTSFSKQTLNLTMGYKKSGINHCVIYDTYRRFTEENFYQTYPKRDVFSFFETYPKKIYLGGGIRIYCL